ncbi:ArgS-related anticodon-binding protein NrtL [Streptomyces sp. NPDC017993]|uniref:ArgS-related anticodon-binding protein NrtL n=1 Tax=Streptomyces sp. NPDC017993 TaxID=3365027 RepID=UPI0037940187
MTPAELSRTVLRSVRGAVEEQELSVPVPARIVVQPPPRPGCGDYASNVALQLAKPAGKPAREVAEILRRRLTGSAGIARVEIAGPGFLNITLGGGAQAALVREVLTQGASYGEYGVGAVPGETRKSREPRESEEPGVSEEPRESVEPGGPVPGARSGGWPVGGGARGLVVAEAVGRIAAAVGVRAPAAHEVTARGGRWTEAEAEDELAGPVARLGADEVRWALLRPAAHDPVRLPERPVQREENPRFRVQYAYARTRALLCNARDLSFGSEPGEVLEPGEAPAAPAPHPPAAAPSADPATTTQALHTLLATYPSVVEAAARHRAPDRVVRHLEGTADAFFRWHDACPPLPVGEQKPLAVHRARLALAEATGTVLANGLRLLGISAPEHL